MCVHMNMHLNTYYKPPVLCMQLSFYLFVLFCSAAVVCCCLETCPIATLFIQQPSEPPIKNESIRQPQYH